MFLSNGIKYKRNTMKLALICIVGAELKVLGLRVTPGRSCVRQ